MISSRPLRGLMIYGEVVYPNDCTPQPAAACRIETDLYTLRPERTPLWENRSYRLVLKTCCSTAFRCLEFFHVNLILDGQPKHVWTICEPSCGEHRTFFQDIRERCKQDLFRSTSPFERRDLLISNSKWLHEGSFVASLCQTPRERCESEFAPRERLAV